jgi:hypothetical protein
VSVCGARWESSTDLILEQFLDSADLVAHRIMRRTSTVMRREEDGFWDRCSEE